MNTKEPELFCRQVNKLIEHGCEITDYEQAIMILNKINYYKLSAYFCRLEIMTEIISRAQRFCKFIRYMNLTES